MLQKYAFIVIESNGGVKYLKMLKLLRVQVVQGL